MPLEKSGKASPDAMTREPGDLPDWRPWKRRFSTGRRGARLALFGGGSFRRADGVERSLRPETTRAGCGAVDRDDFMKRTLSALAACIALPAMTQAHFLLEYTSDTIIDRPGDVPVKLIFWHPFSNGYVMEMDAPREFFMVHHGKRTDLLDTLEPTAFTGSENEAPAFLGSVPVKRSGDYVLVTVPQPYFEESEDKYIQQYTKAFLNRSELPTDWMNPVGLPAEILPLNKPYNVLAGSTFTGRVMSEGQPVAGAEIEVEFMAAEPDMNQARATDPVVSPPPGGAVVILSDDNGYFTFGIPRAGHWGFAALGVGPVTEHEGKELSQDAVIWIRAWELE